MSNDDGLIVAFAVAAAFAASRTVMSTAVSAVTEFATTVKVEPVTLAVIGSAALLLEKTVNPLMPPVPPVMVNVVGRSGNKTAVGGETAKGVPAAGSGAGGALTAPLPHAPSKTTQEANNNSVAPRPIIRFIFTKTPFLKLRHYSNNMAKVLVNIGILAKCLV